MKWEKLGLVFCPNDNFDWMSTHAMIPFAEFIKDDIYKIYFSVRNKKNQGHLASLCLDLNKPSEIFELSTEPLLEPGKLGCFDDSGSIGELLIEIDKRKYLYYTGICLGVTVPLRNSIGLAVWNDKLQKFERCFEGPIVDRTKYEAYFTATPEVLFDQGKFKMWYTSCVRWEMEHGKPKHYYHFKYAESGDGINWTRDGIVAIDFKNKEEYAFGVPRVIKEEGIYKMWYCYRGEKYRIGYAESIDGINWNRMDEKVGIDVSKDGWDSDMICYPFIFDHKGVRYMLYNGNGYGKTGFGLAVLKND